MIRLEEIQAAIETDVEARWGQKLPKNLARPIYYQKLAGVAVELKADEDTVLDALRRHEGDTTQRTDGYLVGEWYPTPTHLRAQIQAVRQQQYQDLKHEQNVEQLEEQQAAERHPGELLPNAPALVKEWTHLTSLYAAHYVKKIPGARPLNSTEQARYKELRAHFNSYPVWPTVRAHWKKGAP